MEIGRAFCSLPGVRRTGTLADMRILAVEPFYGGSHRAFLDGLVRESRHDWQLLTLPDAEWRKRMRLGAQELALRVDEVIGDVDLLWITDMLDLPAFLALTRPRFERVPVLAYFHENQFTYPRIRGTKLNSWFGQINYMTALAADWVAFNSEYHRQDFLAALRTLEGQPNNWLLSGAIERIEAKSSVLPVGVDLAWMDAHRAERDPSQPPLLTWNHRWEFDKSPDLFARVLLRLAERGVEFRVAVAGEPGPNPDPALVTLPELLGEHVIHHGYLPTKADYARLLWQTDIIVSTTRHEFFGVGMVEALYCGCWPVAPNRYNYPALIPPASHTQALWNTEAELEALLIDAILNRRQAGTEFRASAARFAWDVAVREWDTALEAAASN